MPDRENRKRPRVGRATVRCLSFASSYSSEIANKLFAKNAKKEPAKIGEIMSMKHLLNKYELRPIGLFVC